MLGGVPVKVGGCELTTVTVKVWTACKPRVLSVAVIVMDSVVVARRRSASRRPTPLLLIDRLFPLTTGLSLTE